MADEIATENEQNKQRQHRPWPGVRMAMSMYLGGCRPRIPVTGDAGRGTSRNAREQAMLDRQRRLVE